jgi:mRNA interferase HigB
VVDPQAEGPPTAGYALAGKANWAGLKDLKAQFDPNDDFVAGNGVIFDVAENKYRLIARTSYVYKAALIKFVGSHAEYESDPVALLSDAMQLTGRMQSNLAALIGWRPRASEIVDWPQLIATDETEVTINGRRPPPAPVKRDHTVSK